MSKKTPKFLLKINKIKSKINKNFYKNELTITQVILALFVAIAVIIIFLNLV
jgi:hypothetical protein